MAPSCKFKVLEQCKISPPPGTLPTTSLPLTFFDIPWLLFPPSQTLFFFQLPTSSSTTHHFTNSILPNLKHSLSLTLQHFFPLTATLAMPPLPATPHFLYTPADSSVSLTVAESNADFHHISGHHQRDVQEFHHLVPTLPQLKTGSYETRPHLSSCPILAVQVTVFPHCGISIGLAFCHVAADGRTFNNFLKCWASIFRMEPDLNKLPFNDRTVIRDPNGLESILLKQWWDLVNSESNQPRTDADLRDMVQATFVVGRPDMEKIKERILTLSRKIFRSELGSMYLSPYVLTCAHIWVCLTKIRFSMTKRSVGKNPHYFGFIAGGITRLGYPVPDTYLGNCVSFGRSVARGDELVGENGIVVAAKAIGDTIKKLNGDVLGGAENWISDWKELLGSSEHHVMVTGSPKVDLYDLDFGWGRPKKIEEIGIGKTRAVSLTESRDVEGGIEVGLVLPKAQMDAFGSVFRKGLSTDPVDEF